MCRSQRGIEEPHRHKKETLTEDEKFEIQKKSRKNLKELK